MFGNEQNEKKHSHYGIQLLIPINKININGLVTQSSVLIDSYTNHYVYGDAEILSLLINPASNIGRRIKQSFFQHEDGVFIFSNNFKINCYAKDFSNIILEPKEIQKTTNLIIQQLLLDTSQVRPLDDRVSAVKNHIMSSDFSELGYEDTINSVFLSKSRLTHLFKDEMGIPLGKYITWKKLLHASIKLLTSKTKITTVAHEYEFADASHFSRTFKASFGISPGKFIHNIQKMTVSFMFCIKFLSKLNMKEMKLCHLNIFLKTILILIFKLTDYCLMVISPVIKMKSILLLQK